MVAGSKRSGLYSKVTRSPSAVSVRDAVRSNLVVSVSTATRLTVRPGSARVRRVSSWGANKTRAGGGGAGGGAGGEGMDEEADEGLGLEQRPAGDGGADDEVGLPGVAMEQRLEGGEERGEQRCPFLAGPRPARGAGG